ncbi:MAG: hypothetical protein C3F16_09005 [Betaproteobacteria bacterium]|nr:MAG: hypothetical protein C3F16_09005 [Betaproteobacteria bacterium]
MTHAPGGTGPGGGNFLSEGFRELGRKLARGKLRRAIRQHDADRLVALAALGRAAWDGKVDLAAHASVRDRLAGLDARAGELSQATSRLEAEKAGLEAKRREELEAFGARRKAVEATKKPVDAALNEARSRRAACEQAIKQAESRLTAIAGKLAGLERDIASLSAATGPEAQPKAAAAQAERAKLASEQGELGTKLAQSREQLPGHAAEESRLDAESRKHAAEIAAIDAEQKAAIGRIDTDLSRVRTELQGATQQSGAVQKDRDGTFRELGAALYDAGARDPVLAEPVARVAEIDRGRADSEAGVEASLAETRSLPGATMAKFWSVVVGVPLALAAIGAGVYQYNHRPAPVVAMPQPVAKAKAGACEMQKAPENGAGVAVKSDCQRSEGTFVAGQLQKGKITYPDGRVREGTFVGGAQAGKGTLSWADGRRYEGHFVDGRSMGPGEFVAADGTRYRGMFKPGVRLHGMGARTSPDGSVLLGEFVDGKPSPKMVLVKGGKAELVDTADSATAPGGTATVEPVGR